MPDLSLIFNLSSLVLLFYLYPLVKFYCLDSNPNATDLEMFQLLRYLLSCAAPPRDSTLLRSTNDPYMMQSSALIADDATHHWKGEQVLTLQDWPCTKCMSARLPIPSRD